MELVASQIIKLYMQTQVVIGSISYAPTPEARLIDALNGVTDRGPVKKGRFLELTDVTIQHADGIKEKLKSTYINKSTIQLAITLGDADSGRGLGAHDGPKVYPYVEKVPLAVRIETHDFAIIGNMYHILHQQVWIILEDTAAFLPITHARVVTLSNGTVENVPFVALNKEHILSLQAENGKIKPRGAANRIISKRTI